MEKKTCLLMACCESQLLACSSSCSCSQEHGPEGDLFQIRVVERHAGQRRDGARQADLRGRRPAGERYGCRPEGGGAGVEGEEGAQRRRGEVVVILMEWISYGLLSHPPEELWLEAQLVGLEVEER